MSNAPSVAPEQGAAAAPSVQFRIEAMVFVGLFLALGVAIVVGAFEITVPAGGSGLSPQVVPIAVGALMIASSVIVIIEQILGRFGEPDGGEDIDLDTQTSWVTVLLIFVSFASLIVTIGLLGWPLGVAILFYGAATALGARPWWKSVLIGLIIGVFTQYVFGTLLGLSLPATGVLTSWVGL